MTCGLVHTSYSLPKWQAVKLTFFAPCNCKINILCENVNAFVYLGKNALNLQVEIILGIISIIILSSLIVLNRIIIILFLLNPALIGFPQPVAFPKLTQFSRLIFLFNIIWFILILFGHQTLKKAVFDIVQWPNCIKLLFERV